jgi:hypothetical protein
VGSNKLLPWLQQIMDGFCKADPPTTKQLPVEADVSEFFVKLGLAPEPRKLYCSAGDLNFIAFYYLLRIGEYTIKGAWKNSKQTEELKMGDIMFFAKDTNCNLWCLLRDEPDNLIAGAEGATMKLDNQKNGWKGVCVYQKTNGDPIFCPVRALGRQYLHLWANRATEKTIISAYYHEGKLFYVTSDHVSTALKTVVTATESNLFHGTLVVYFHLPKIRTRLSV